MLAPGLHRIELSGTALQGVNWSLGDKLQLKTGAGLQTRTYTPMSWDAAEGHTAFLAHSLAQGPGSEWVRSVRPGDTIAVFGPRRSLDLTAMDAERSVLVGDETALGLAASWRPGRAVFEVNHRSALQPVVEALGLSSSLVERKPEESHFDALIEAIPAQETNRHFVLVGRARTIQTLVRALRQRGVPAGRIRTKAYWADGKAGLD